ncbi:hypothetical protein [Streptomyces sp. NPDC013740]|uniref:hypothetical protein n=1 Tax=Streptomyces sp. NPDC013740 TaxID=3364867 RepID=UPI0036F5A006
MAYTESDTDTDTGAGEGGRTVARMVRVSVLVLLLDLVAVWVGFLVWDETQPGPSSGDNPLGLLLLPFLLGAALLAAAVVSRLLVLPALGLSEVLERRFGGRAWWWLVLVAGVPGMLLVPLLGAWWWWPVGWAGLALAGLTARRARRGSFVTVLLWGTLVVVCVGTLGAISLSTGLLRSYAPPLLSVDALVGTWTDGDGGTLTFTADGRVRVVGVEVESLDEDERSVVEDCAGEGSWGYRGADDPWAQEVELRVDACSWPAWKVGGSAAEPTLYQVVGDMDAWNAYAFRKVPPTPATR